jgi:hypothetical protein
MSEERFKSIIQDVMSWPVHPQVVCPFLTNEPFADARIFEFCQLINDLLPNTVLAFYTNGSLFTPQAIIKLRKVTNISVINISLHHSNAADYEAELEIPFNKTLESIDRLLIAHKLSPIANEVTLLKVGNQEPDKDQAFLSFCAQRFPGVKAWIAPRWNWKGDIQSKDPYEPWLDMVCPRSVSMCILATGKVALCCLDQEAKYSTGDLNNQTLLEVYNGALATKQRTTNKRDLVPCKSCNMR